MKILFLALLNVKNILSEYNKSQISKLLISEIETDKLVKGYSLQLQKVLTPNVGFFKQLLILTDRGLKNNIKHVGMYWSRITIYLLLSLFVSGMYYQPEDGQSTNKAGMLFFVQSYLIILTIAALPYLIQVLPVFVTERRNGSLKPLPFVISTFFATLPGVFASSGICAVIIHYFTSMHNLMILFVILFTTLLAAESTISLIASLANELILGAALSSGIYGVLMLNSGFFLPCYAIPNHWQTFFRLFHNFGFHTYSLRSLFFNEFNSFEYLVPENRTNNYGYSYLDAQTRATSNESIDENKNLAGFGINMIDDNPEIKPGPCS